MLRDAGLISSSRQRNSERHALTPMGLALLDDSPAGRYESSYSPLSRQRQSPV
ncbi:hypothetical protein [Streptomyces sp. NPDC058240]|uniref:hypothetical protein n=1 Tax=Streptomyces sp. NPDC058240 TaxID=3346396 RepID=UPI0036E36A2E